MAGELLARGLSPRTTELYMRVIVKAQRWCSEQGYELATVPATTIMEWVHAQPRGHSARKIVRSGLGHYWDVVERDERRPMISLPPQPLTECRALEPEDAETLAEAAIARHDQVGLAVLLGLYLALRRFEIAKLRWDDFRPDWSEVHVIGKRAVDAWLPVHPFLGDCLRTWPRFSAWVFPSVKANRPHVGPSTIWEWTRLVAADAGLPPIAPHVLRHTALAQANDVTKDLRAVQRFARHKDPEMTSRYTRTTKARMNAVVMALDFARPRPAESPPAEEDGGLRLAA